RVPGPRPAHRGRAGGPAHDQARLRRDRDRALPLHEAPVTAPSVVEVVGELDLSTVAHWEATVGRASRGAEIVVLDVTRVEFLDSAGVHALFRMLSALQNQRKRLVIVAPNAARVRRLLEILDLPSLAWVCDSLDEALRAAESTPPGDVAPSGGAARLPIQQA